jgi:hypothetical protein
MLDKRYIFGIWAEHTRGRSGCDRMEVEFTITYAISAYHHYCCEFEYRSLRVVLDTTLCKFVSDLQHDADSLMFPPWIKLIAEILLKVTLITLTPGKCYITEYVTWMNLVCFYKNFVKVKRWRKLNLFVAVCVQTCF